ncbi:hypothetical protein BST46_30895 [Mycobacterium timonense]|uniref:Uncharacterized protein n=1 Tax=Mycobacterium timonense TaxID=701043 RepID=A0ABX3TBX4_9MYCO|nr:hypothetical protein BST46_30895 [Mycobacterium timonense]
MAGHGSEADVSLFSIISDSFLVDGIGTPCRQLEFPRDGWAKGIFIIHHRPCGSRTGVPKHQLLQIINAIDE